MRRTPKPPVIWLLMAVVTLLVTGLEARGQIVASESELAVADADVRAASGVPASVNRPISARRVVRSFDFEEQRTNPTPVPRYWVRAQDERTIENGVPQVARDRRGFPAWNSALLDYESKAYRGVGSVKLPTTGGSTSLLLEAGVIPIFQNADYNISAYIRTEKLAFARARLVVRLLDASGSLVADGEHASELVVSDGQWRPVSIDVEAASDNAAFLELEIQLLQPEQFGKVAALPSADSKVGEKKAGKVALAFGQDLAGAAWFDDLTVTQLPRIELVTNGVGHIVQSPDRPELRLDIRDLTGEKLRAELTVFDTRGRVVDQVSRPLGSGRVRAPWTPKLPGFGWYRAALGVFNEKTIVGQSMVDLVWLPREVDEEDARATAVKGGAVRKLGLQVGEMPERMAADLPEMMKRLGLGAVAIALPLGSVTPETAAERVRESAASIDLLLEHGVEITLAIDRMPEEYEANHRADLSDPWTALRTDAAGWEPYLDPFLEKYGQRVRRWRVGRVNDDVAFWRSELAEDLTAAQRNLERLVSLPTICVPWRIDRGLSAAVLGSMAESTQLSVLVPEDVPYGAIEDFARLWKQAFASDAGSGGASGSGRAPELAMIFEPMPAEEYGYEAGPADLVKRAVMYWRGFDPSGIPGGSIRPPTAFLSSPWEYREGRTADLRPRPELAAWANLNRRLADRQIVGELKIVPGVRCFILAPTGDAALGRGALVAWNESADPKDAVLHAYLGPGRIRVVDLYGNSTDATVDESNAAANEDGSASARRPEIVVPLGAEPVFIEGIDPMLTRFLASVRFEPTILASTNENHENALVFENPWTTGLDLRAYVIKPGGLDANGVKDRTWKISPRAARVIVPSGEMGRIPITIAFSPAEEAGMKDFVLDLEVTADKAYGLIRLHTSLELGLQNVKLELTPVVLSNGDVLIEAQVSNTGALPVDIELTAFAPGQPRVKNQINRLPAGNQVVRRFPYPGAAKDLIGKRVFVAATDAETKGRLNKGVMVE